MTLGNGACQSTYRYCQMTALAARGPDRLGTVTSNRKRPSGPCLGRAQHARDDTAQACAAACGFPSPADDYLDRSFDFNELIIENLAATFAVQVVGESMTGAGIFPGDIAVVPRARSPVDG